MNTHIFFNRYTLAISFVAMVVVNALANILPINNQSTGEISDAIGAYFAPDAYVFSIWGVIYTALALHVGYQWLYGNKEKLQALLPWWILNFLTNATWIVLWHYNQLFGTVIAMLIILATLIILYLQRPTTSSSFEWWSVRFPIQLYLGWISVATIANIAAWLQVEYVGEHTNWLGFSTVGWTGVMIAVAMVLGVIMLLREHDYTFAAVIIWASLGLYTKYFSIDAISMIAITSLVILTLLSAVIMLYRQLTGQPFVTERESSISN